MAATEAVQISTINQDDQISPPHEPRINTDSMVSIALSDITQSTAGADNPEISPIDSQEEAISSGEEDDSLHALPEPISDTGAYVVPALQSPNPGRQSKSRHVRGRSSLQEPDMAALLARLEMENQAIAKDPKAGIAAVGAHTGPGATFEYRVRDTVCSSLSLVNIPEDALGMSLGDFWALVTKDYDEALRLLPTMTPLMIHKGVPDFLRSAVWVGIAGAWDASLQVEFDSLSDRLRHEKPQNEHIINKDLARCFPHHEFFRDAEGEGQQMLGTLLKCYSLYDSEIGYCQGMAFVAGALLLNMPLKDAFCVFVKLMENHNLRTLYSVDLAGLHSRTFQLKKFMAQISPELLQHLETLGLEMAYLSQWFMTLFATSCPLNVLFRIYDVVFAEGADETIMRVALALILSNEQKIMAMKELEDVLQLFLGRRLWEPYQAEPDFLMDEIARLSNVVTREELNKLESQFDEQAVGGDNAVRALGFTSGWRIFDHFRTPSTTKAAPRSQSTTTLLEMPSGHVPRRSVSKRSTATIDSSAGSGSGSDSLMSADSQSTAPTEFEAERSSVATSKSARKTEDHGLHEQVEGLLLALTEVQREAAETAAQLQAEHRRKESMAEIVLRLRDLITQKEQVQDTVKRERRKTMPSKVDIDNAQNTLKHLRRKSILINTAARSVSLNNLAGTLPDAELQESLQRLCSILETDSEPTSGTPKSEMGSFFDGTARAPSIADSDRNARSKRRDSVRFDMSRDASQRGNKSPPQSLKDSRKDSPCMAPTPDPLHTPTYGFEEADDYWPGPALSNTDSLQTPSAPHTPHPRQSSLQARDVLRVSGTVPAADEAILVELVNAKTREATAMHERDEMKVQIDKLRRAHDAALAREADTVARLAEMERLMAVQRLAMQAQDEMHNAELARVREAAAPKKPSRSPAPASPAEKAAQALWPAAVVLPPEPSTPTKLQPPQAEPSSAWSWFGKKGRSVSTGGVV
ncbi:TBC-domain-containing protein [Myriangium duriaei CBS 260.36]|uniref:TBC-domain-containing protein n=1 Tax=Myriangium duriaei CBS 260.36 TaxID=1168546 RepID=A0A9P4IT71_9PEZI|nr:TBC-domain-containing protein [Myriangium duriaei CBS 260.36]